MKELLPRATGIFAVAVVLVVSYRVVRQSLKLAVEVFLLGAALVVLARLGWLRW